MIWFSEGELLGEVCRCYRREVAWFWYRDVLRQAEERGFLRITADSEDVPFWWRIFEDSVAVTSERLSAVLKEETKWRKGVEHVATDQGDAGAQGQGRQAVHG